MKTAIAAAAAGCFIFGIVGSGIGVAQAQSVPTPAAGLTEPPPFVGTGEIRVVVPSATPLDLDDEDDAEDADRPARVSEAPPAGGTGMPGPGYGFNDPFMSDTLQSEPLGTAFLVGGGVVEFTESAIRSMTNQGGFWNARLILGTRQVLAIEAAYVGSARDIVTLGLDPDAMLIGHGVEGNMRLNIPIISEDAIFEPFGFVGVGWSRYQISHSRSNTSAVANDDDVMELPYGCGISFGGGGFFADVRYTFRKTYYNDLFRNTMQATDILNSWSVGGQIGFEF